MSIVDSPDKVSSPNSLDRKKSILDPESYNTEDRGKDRDKELKKKFDKEQKRKLQKEPKYCCFCCLISSSHKKKEKKESLDDAFKRMRE